MRLKKRSTITAWVAAALVCACTSDPGTKITLQRPEVSAQAIEGQFDVQRLDTRAVESLAENYRSSGGTGLDLTVTYDPNSRSFGPISAEKALRDVVARLERNGVETVAARILPVNSAAMSPQLLVSYTAHSAHAPRDCALMAGLENRNLQIEEEYRLGCSVETLIARQIARPQDLLGNEGAEKSTGDGRRQSNIVDLYRTGRQNEPLQGESASGGN